MKRTHTLRENVKKSYALIWGQCTDSLKDQLESLPTYSGMDKTSDVILLIHAMKQVIFKFDATKYNFQALEEAMLKWYRFYQTPTMSNVDFIEGIKTRVDVIEQCGGSVCSHPDLVTAEYQALMNANNGVAEPNFHHKAKEAVKNKYLGVAALVRADRKRYGKVLEDLENEYVKGVNNYPTSLVQAHHYLNNMKDRSLAGRKARVLKDEAGVVFTNLEKKGNSSGKGGQKTGVDKTDKVCFSCGETGHYASDPECPNSNKEKTQHTSKTGVTQLNWLKEEDEYEFSFLNFSFVNNHQNGNLTSNVLDPSWILLDNQSSVDIFCNRELLRDIHTVDSHVLIYCNAGTHRANQQGFLPGYGWVWYSESAIANILSLSRVAETHAITYDSTDGLGFVVHREGSPPLIFRQTQNGLFVHDTRMRSVLMVNTVEEAAATFSQHDQVQAQTARELQFMMGNPSDRDFETAITHNVIRNIPVNVQDARNANFIYGQNIMSIRGRTTERRSIPVETDIIPVPENIRELHQNVQLPTDVFFINGIPFALSVSRKLDFITVQVLEAATLYRLHKYLTRVSDFYRNRGFTVSEVLADGQFKAMRDALMESSNVLLNTTAANEHVKEAERKIRVVKERVRGICTSLPFTKIPIRMIVDLVYFCVLWLNGVPHKNGISETLSPRTILTGTTLDASKHCRVPFGAYCQVKEPTTNRTDIPRTIGAISLGPTGNRQGSYRFLNLSTGRRITREQFQSLPIPQDVVQRVEQLAEAEGQSEGLEFRDGRRNLIEDSNNDAFFDEITAEPAVHTDEEAQIPPHAHFDNVPIETPGVDGLTTGVAPDEHIPTTTGVVEPAISTFSSPIRVEEASEDSDYSAMQLDDVALPLDDTAELRAELDELSSAHMVTSPPNPNIKRESHNEFDLGQEVESVDDFTNPDIAEAAGVGADFDVPATLSHNFDENAGVDNAATTEHGPFSPSVADPVSHTNTYDLLPSPPPIHTHNPPSNINHSDTGSYGDLSSISGPESQQLLESSSSSQRICRERIGPSSIILPKESLQKSPKKSSSHKQAPKTSTKPSVSQTQKHSESHHECTTRDSRAYSPTKDAIGSRSITQYIRSGSQSRTNAKSSSESWSSLEPSSSQQPQEKRTAPSSEQKKTSQGSKNQSHTSSHSSKWEKQQQPSTSGVRIRGDQRSHNPTSSDKQCDGRSSSSNGPHEESYNDRRTQDATGKRTLPSSPLSTSSKNSRVLPTSTSRSGRSITSRLSTTTGGKSKERLLNVNSSEHRSEHSLGDPSFSSGSERSGYSRAYDSELTIAPSSRDSVNSSSNEFLKTLADGARALGNLREAIDKSWSDQITSGSSASKSESSPDDGEVEISDEDEFVVKPGRYVPSIQRVHQTRYRKRMNQEKEDDKELEDHVVHVALTQMSWKAGLKTWGDRAEEAITKEFKQFHEFDCFNPVHSVDLTEEEKDQAIKSLMFLKEKRCGRIKARTCADGRPQREIFSKHEVSSPTVQIESVLITAAIDATENRDVATVDIPGAFLQADMEDNVVMKLEGKLAELMVKTVPSIYRPYIEETPNGKSILYVKLKKAVYGCLKSALLFYKKLSNDLEEIGFEKNPYDPCVANMKVDGKQLTVTWHVDDLKISHEDSKVVDRMIKWLENKYGKIVEHRGKKHDYLGMDIDFSTPGMAKISMERYIKQTIEEFPDVIDSTTSTPAGSYLFSVNEDSPTLPEEQAQSFHTAVARLLFVSGRARPDIKTTISFLTTRVKHPTEEDWIKLKRLLKYLNGTADLCLCVNADNVNINKWWIDGSYAVHPNMRSHTGASFSIGAGATLSNSSKQKINTRSSTEAELVAVNDIMGQMMWTRYFIEAQGYKVDKTVVFQDNQSAILLEENGRGSSSKRTRHLNVRYFFIKDRIDSGEMKVEYCPTEEMIGDFFTKPLQGALFRKFRSAILNYHPDEMKIAQECVGETAKRPVDKNSSEKNSADGEVMTKHMTQQKKYPRLLGVK